MQFVFLAVQFHLAPGVEDEVKGIVLIVHLEVVGKDETVAAEGKDVDTLVVEVGEELAAVLALLMAVQVAPYRHRGGQYLVVVGVVAYHGEDVFLNGIDCRAVQLRQVDVGLEMVLIAFVHMVEQCGAVGLVLFLFGHEHGGGVGQQLYAGEGLLQERARLEGLAQVGRGRHAALAYEGGRLGGGDAFGIGLRDENLARSDAQQQGVAAGGNGGGWCCHVFSVSSCKFSHFIPYGR